VRSGCDVKHAGPRWAATYRLFSHPESVQISRALVAPVARLAGFEARDVLDLQIAVAETVSNAFVHGYRGRPEGRIEIDLEFDGVVFTIGVYDAGHPLAGRIAVPETPPPPGQGGRGLYLIARLMDSVEIRQPGRRGRGTAVVMKKHVRQPVTVDGGESG